jgi:hypothetical protein
MTEFSGIKKILPLRPAIAKELTSILVILCALLYADLSEAGNTSFYVDRSINIIDGLISPYNNLKPGDTLKLEAGQRDYLLIMNLEGAPGNPVVITNSGGAVVIDTDHYYGISVRNCRHFRITGQGDSEHLYGIRIERVARGAGIGVGNLSSFFEIDHLYITDCAIGGIYAKSDLDCNFLTTQDKFTQRNTVIHNNYIGNVGDEGIYIGNTQFFGQTVRCQGLDTLLMPSLLDGVQVYSNIVENSGWDGIQVSAAINNCNIYNNIIRFDSQKEHHDQMSGILLGGGSKCDCFNNLITDGKGNGIENHGLGGNRIYNNIIINAGLTFKPTDVSQMKHGIFISDVSTMQDSSYFILFNHILNPKSDGIRFQSTLSQNNLIASNLIVNPGNFDYYETGNFSFKGIDAYIMVPSSLSKVNIHNNFFAQSVETAMVSQIDLTPLSGSPLIDTGYSFAAGIQFDYNYKPRPIGMAYDIGAFESDWNTAAAKPVNNVQKNSLNLYPNPVKDILTLRMEKADLTHGAIKIYTMSGFAVLHYEIRVSHNKLEPVTIPTDKLPPGIYMITVPTNCGMLSQRFIKSR